MDIGRAFSYMFVDKDWVKKILIGGLMVLIPIFGWCCLIGYMVQLIRTIKEGREIPLPEWTNFGDLFMTGLMGFVTILIYMLPAIVLGIIPCIGFILSIPYNLLVMPVALIMFTKYGEIGKALQFSEAIELIKIHWMNILIVGLMQIVFSLIASLGLIALCIGYLFTAFWAGLAHAQLVGQLWKIMEPGQPVTPTPTV